MTVFVSVRRVNMRVGVAVAALVIFSGVAALAGQNTARPAPRVVFVCEHGAAKSVVVTLNPLVITALTRWRAARRGAVGVAGRRSSAQRPRPESL